MHSGGSQKTPSFGPISKANLWWLWILQLPLQTHQYLLSMHAQPLQSSQRSRAIAANAPSESSVGVQTSRGISTQSMGVKKLTFGAQRLIAFVTTRDRTLRHARTNFANTSVTYTIRTWNDDFGPCGSARWISLLKANEADQSIGTRNCGYDMTVVA